MEKSDGLWIEPNSNSGFRARSLFHNEPLTASRGLELDPHLRNKQKPKESSRGLPDCTCNTLFTWIGDNGQSCPNPVRQRCSSAAPLHRLHRELAGPS
ncbi:hypothetical protein Q8A67_014984 [Cirrhinus molitorella]|uniref:Uncharacterized protein n=1 Tax=Cirrhinus molitorella TaxID=172907 RepID=A0AA88PPK3_9TELE|nr:hypothetical protein Q8A67_014984 [Cirrhinus molitorella]